jgi:hypothetical protein
MRRFPPASFSIENIGIVFIGTCSAREWSTAGNSGTRDRFLRSAAPALLSRRGPGRLAHRSILAAVSALRIFLTRSYRSAARRRVGLRALVRDELREAVLERYRLLGTPPPPLARRRRLSLGRFLVPVNFFIR